MATSSSSCLLPHPPPLFRPIRSYSSLRLYSDVNSKWKPLIVVSSSPHHQLPIDRKEEKDKDKDGFAIVVDGKNNRRRIRARVGVDAALEAVWAALTDYDGLADFIPSLSESRLLQQSHSFARLYQVGQQDLALGFKFNAKLVVDCYEKEMEFLPNGLRRREIDFNMVEGDFQLFQGKWSVQQANCISEDGQNLVEHQFQTLLFYMVELEPKLWVPVRLLEGRICKEVRTNLMSVREEAQRIQQLGSKVTVELCLDEENSKEN